MKQFNVLIFKPLPNEAHFNFFDRATKEVANASSTVITALGSLPGELNAWFVKETACIKWYRKDPLTAAIADADAHLDQVVVGFSAQVNGTRYDSNPTIAAAGERLYAMLRSHSRVSTKPYEQKIGAVKAILLHLNGDLSGDLSIASLTRWPGEISEALATFISLMEQRETRTLLKPEDGFPVVRRGIEGVWHQIVTIVNAGAALGQAGFSTLIDKLNPEINYLNDEFHRVRHDISAAEPAPIKQQAYTGQPCTPVPEVFYVTPKGTIKLELGKDFDVSYKKNVDVGNAQCTLHGKGGYRGRRIVTFIIARQTGE
jgi:hypothetical protein